MNSITAIQPDIATIADEYVGRTSVQFGLLSQHLAGMVSAAVSRTNINSPDIKAGAPMPPLWHWAAFPEFVAIQDLSNDGHPKLGGFLPKLPYPRRMWAGGELRFDGQLSIGETLTKDSEILSISEKGGATGSMVFVSVAHRIKGAKGAIEERQDIVYLDIPPVFRAPRPVAPLASPDFSETVDAGPVRLFRFSAATFNAHRIHYDLTYAQEVEKYPALVVHGPLQAIFLMEAATRHANQNPKRFSFRGVHPMFHDSAITLMGARMGARDAKSDAFDLCTASDGHRGMSARMEWV